MAEPDDDVVLTTTEESLDNGLHLQHSRARVQSNAEGNEEDCIRDSDWHEFLEDIRLLIPYELDGYQVYLKIRHYAQRLVTLAEYDIDFADLLPDKHDHESLGLLLEHVKEVAERNERIAFDSAWEGFVLEANETRPGYDHIVSEMQTRALDNLKAAQLVCGHVLPHYRLDVGQILKEFVHKTREDVKQLGPTLDVAGLDGSWHYEWSIGKGGYGEAGLWFRTDQNGRIVERMVIKDVVLTQDEWAHKRQWSDGSRPATGRTIKTPMEAHIQGLMTVVSKGRSIVPLRTFAVIPNRRLYRLYMPFMPHGNLLEVVQRHLIERRPRGLTTPTVWRTPIAENFCWALFLTLVEAGCFMKRGALPADSITALWDHDDCIIHFDMKPNNVFLGEVREDEHAQEWPGFPSIKLADWGVSAMAKSPLYQNPKDFKGRGTPGWRAPEHRETAVRELPVGSPANVWCIGRMMLCIMSLDMSVSGETRSIEEYPFIRHNYSTTLIDLVSRCLYRAPEERIEIAELFRCVDGHVRNDGPDGTALINRRKEVKDIVRWSPAKIQSSLH